MHGRTACVISEVENLSSVPRDVQRSAIEEVKIAIQFENRTDCNWNLVNCVRRW